MVDLWSYTANSTARDASIIFSASHSYKELIAPVFRQKLRGFCVNKKCINVDECHRINGKTVNRKYSTSDSTKFSCANCSYALFWTKKWQEE